MWNSWMHGGWGLGMGLLWILFVVALVILVPLALRGSARRGDGPTAAPTPLEILQRRYASGEISREEYERMRHDLA